MAVLSSLYAPYVGSRVLFHSCLLSASIYKLTWDPKKGYLKRGSWQSRCQILNSLHSGYFVFQRWQMCYGGVWTAFFENERQKALESLFIHSGKKNCTNITGKSLLLQKSIKIIFLYESKLISLPSPPQAFPLCILWGCHLRGGQSTRRWEQRETKVWLLSKSRPNHVQKAGRGCNEGRQESYDSLGKATQSWKNGSETLEVDLCPFQRGEQDPRGLFFLR